MTRLQPRRTASPGKAVPAGITPARWVAYRVVHRTFREDAWTDRAFAGEADRAQLAGRDRAFAQRIAYGAVQRAAALDHVIGTVGKRPLRKIDPPVLDALRLGMYELLETAGGDHAAVDQAVEIVRSVCGERPVAFTNAVLRRGQADGESILSRLDPDDDDERAVRLSMPSWLVARMRSDFGEQGIAALDAQNAPLAATALRINTQHPAAERWHADDDLEIPEQFATVVPEARWVHGSTAALSDAMRDGQLVPQSLASMLVTAALEPQSGERVLDMCAAPGNKTTHIADRMGGAGSIVACELHESRAASIGYLAARMHVGGMIDVRTVDATTLTPDADGHFDRVLVDAPCSGSGTLRGRPDARWRTAEDDIESLAQLQRRLLATAARMVRPGGVVVYSTCSMLVDEGDAIVASALANPDLDLEPDPLPDTLERWAVVEATVDGTDSPYVARTWPHEDPTDGFFLARLRRRAAE